MDAKEFLKQKGIIFQQDGTCCLQKEWLIKHLTEFAQFSQQPTDSVDAKEFLKKFSPELSNDECYPVFVNIKGQEYSLAQLLTEFAGSKVKPVNEKMREALQELVDIEQAQHVTNLEYLTKMKLLSEKAKIILSTAPDDGWIPVECPPKEKGEYLVCDYDNMVRIDYFNPHNSPRAWMLSEYINEKPPIKYWTFKPVAPKSPR